MIVIIVDEMIDIGSDKNCECKGQGLVNIVIGLFGGMVGCVMIGQLVINVKFGGCSWFLILVVGVVLLLMVVFFSDWVGWIFMVVLVVVMIMVFIGIFCWELICNLKCYLLLINLVMLVMVGVVFVIYNLVFGVVVGVFLVLLFFVNKIGYYFDIDSECFVDGICCYYQVSGQVFFVLFGRFIVVFDLREMLEYVFIDLCYVYLWDVIVVVVLDKVVLGFCQCGVQVDVLGLNVVSVILVDCFGVYDKLGVVDIFFDY